MKLERSDSMKHVLLSAVAVLALGAGSAFAQAPADPLAGAPGAALPAPGADAAAEVTPDVVIAAANGIDTEITELGALAAGATIHVVPLDDLVAGAAGADVTAALTASEAKRDALRAALQGNAQISAELQAQSVSLDNVVAVDVGANGEVLIFTQA
jgi:hypothetical protein